MTNNKKDERETLIYLYMDVVYLYYFDVSVHLYIYEFNAVTRIVILKKKGLFKSHDEM